MTQTELPASSLRRAHTAEVRAEPMVVGLGASEGGWVALEQFLSNVPEHGGLAFILVLAQEYSGPGGLAQRVAETARIAVSVAQDGCRVEAGHLYVNPPNAALTLERGLLRVGSWTERGPQDRVDALFRSLAAELGARAVAILLSGAGTDGTSGFRAIREQGGWTLAQAPETALQDGMIRSALAAAVVDAVLPVEQLPARLVEHLDAHARNRREGAEPTSANAGLQSWREQLQVTNDALRHTVEQLATSNRDLQNALASAQVAALFLDPELRISKATPAAEALFNLRDLDVGRPMVDLAQRFLGQELMADAREVLRTCVPVERQLQAPEGRAWFMMRTAPYRRADGGLGGVVTTLMDVTTLKEATERLRESDERHRVLAETMLQGVVHQDAAGQIISMNPAAERILGKTREELLGNTSMSVEHPTIREDGTAFPGLEHPAMVALRTGQPVREVAMGVFHPREQAYRWISVDAVPVFRPRESTPYQVYTVFADITARKAAEQALRESQQKSAIHDNAPVAIALTRMPEGTIASVNAAFLELFECTAAEVVGKTSVELGFADQASRAQVAAALRERGAVRDFECVRTTRSGRKRTLSLNVDNVEIGGCAYCLSTAQDITERKLLERHAARIFRLYAVLSKVNEAILRSRSPAELYQQVCGIMAGDGERPLVWIGRVEGRLVKPVAVAGPEAGYVQGLRVELDGEWSRGPTGTCIREGRTVVIDDFDTNPATESWRALAQRHNLRAAAAFPLRHRGTVVGAVTLYGRSAGTFDPEQVALLEALGADISFALDTMSQEHALRASETRYRALFENNMDAIFLTNAHGVVTAANPTACATFGWTEQELLQRGRAGVVDPGEPRLASALREQARTGRFRGELTYRRKDGSSFPAEVHSVVYAADPPKSFVILRDISERKQVEEELRQANAQLRDADRRKNEFLAVLSHELRNPLAPIRNSLTILDHVPPGGREARHAHAVIDRQTHQLARLVDDLLDVTRINCGKIQIQPTRLDLAEVLRRAVADHRSEFTLADLGLELQVPDQGVWLHADGARLAQAVGNLLQNAAKFTPRGGRVQVVLEQDAAARTAVIRVKDSGVGIAPDVLARLFQPFTQADATLDRSRGGLGLGLALVRGLAELHGGTAEARSDGCGKGAEFILRLPLLQDVSAPVSLVSAVTGAPPPRRILIIEDNVDSGDTLKEVLVISGHTVEVALNGRAGLQLARTFTPDVVLCDVGLPDMDGYGVARAFRAEPQWQDLVLVALSGYARPEDRAMATEAGFNHHVAKPANLTAIERILAGTAGPPRK